MSKREVDWLTLQTSGKEYLTVVLHHTTYPKGPAKYSYPSAEAAERFARNNSLHPGISHAEVLDSKGRLVLEFKANHKHAVSWEDTGNGMTEIRKCEFDPKCKEI